MKHKITLGIDSSTSSTGWAFRDENGNIKHGIAKGKSSDWFERSRQIANNLVDILKDYDIINIVIEKPIKKASIDTTIKCAIANGIVIGALPHSYSMEVLPSEWRSWYGLKGGNTKGQTKRTDWKEAAIQEALKLGYKISYKTNKKGEITYIDDEAEAIIILLAAEKKGL
ncbi:holliday junction resolvase [Lactococcus phage Nocturne116]|nr:holliday junction resolvase [Lactococcus phage Nocturne116]